MPLHDEVELRHYIGGTQFKTVVRATGSEKSGGPAYQASVYRFSPKLGWCLCSEFRWDGSQSSILFPDDYYETDKQ